jgi:hypothetical protein
MVASKKKRVKTSAKRDKAPLQLAQANYPRHTVERALRIPAAILDQNAGKPCTESEAARLLKVGVGGPFRVEIASGIKYGFLKRPERGKIEITDLARKILRPQHPQDKIEGLRQAIANAPVIADVYAHYRGENLPDQTFLQNALVDKFG